jgi:hypothetical protein
LMIFQKMILREAWFDWPPRYSVLFLHITAMVAVSQWNNAMVMLLWNLKRIVLCLSLSVGVNLHVMELVSLWADNYTPQCLYKYIPQCIISANIVLFMTPMLRRRTPFGTYVSCLMLP